MGSNHVKVIAALLCLLSMMSLPSSAQAPVPVTAGAVAEGALWQGTVTVTHEDTWKEDFYSRNYKTKGVWTTVGGGTGTEPRNARLPVRLVGEYSDREWSASCDASYAHTGQINVTNSSSDVTYPSVYVSIGQNSASYEVNAYAGVLGTGTKTTTSTCSPATTSFLQFGINHGASGAQLYDPRMTHLTGTSTTPFYRAFGVVGGDDVGPTSPYYTHGWKSVRTITWDLTLAPDADRDGVPNETDKCPTLKHPQDQLDEDGDGIGDACDEAKTRPGLSEAEAVRKFAPVVRLDRHDTESYPMDPGWFVHKSRLMWAVDDASDSEIVARGKVAPRRLGGYTGPTMPDDPYTVEEINANGITSTYTTGYQLTAPAKADKPYHLPRARRAGFYLEGEGKDMFNPNSPGPDGQPTLGLPRDPQAPAAIHPRPPTLYYEFAHGKYIIYWFFYGYNGRTIDEHEGDWEKIVVKLDAQNEKATAVAYYQHYCDPSAAELGMIPWERMEADGYLAADDQGGPPTHPIVYSARYAHASYPKNVSGPDDSYLWEPCGPINPNGGADRTSDGGWTWLTAKGSFKNAATEPWYGFGGAWGKKLDTKTYGVGWGPLGPGDVMWRTDPPVPQTWAQEWAKGRTASGTSITVPPEDLRTSKSPVTVTYSFAWMAGDTFLTLLRERPPLPVGYKNGRDYFDLRTTKEHSGKLHVCTKVSDQPWPLTAAAFARLGMIRWVGTTATALQVLPENRNFPTRTICATSEILGAAGHGTQELGTFAIAEQVDGLVLPDLALSSPTLHFAARRDGTGFSATTPSQTVMLAQQGIGHVTWTATAVDPATGKPQPWVRVSPASGIGGAALTISVDYAHPSLPPFGPATARLNITPTGARNAPSLSVSVEMVTAARAPWGVIDTPGDGAQGVTGSLAITGWALDDVDVRSVRITRDPVPGEAPGQQIFIGEGSFVTGSRPDIAALEPSTPNNLRAGWGYLLLTNFLPNQGNGTFRLHAHAVDAEGNSTPLGSRIVTCTNATAIDPFGAIDTPTQGGSASGTQYVNFGWVLAPKGKTIPHDGSTVQVYVDSVPVGILDSFNNPRTDIQSLFPGYQNSNGAVGFKMIDTTKLAPGVHTIAWVATDSAGASAGIGSRYFTVTNGAAAAPLAEGAVAAERSAAAGLTTAPDLSRLPVLRSSLGVRHGWNADAATITAEPAADGVVHVQAVELQPVRISLGPPRDPDTRYQGYAMTGDVLAPLPIGSTLDRETGEFTWAPPLAFGGVHPLVFVIEGSGRTEQIRVNVSIVPDRAATRDPHIVIDTPLSGVNVRQQPFTIAGWAIDPAGPAHGPGIQTLHVWAYPAAGGDPLWVGVAEYGGLRHDVAELLGRRFLASGFGLEVANLPSGSYDVVVFGRSAATLKFSIVQTVRVNVQ